MNILTYERGVLLERGENSQQKPNNRYTFRLKVVDKGIPSKLDEITDVTLIVADVNDNAPVFDSETLEKVRMVEDLAVGTQVALVRAQDADESGLAAVRYAFDPNRPPPDGFSIHPVTGAITITRVHDFDNGDSGATLSIIATDADNIHTTTAKKEIGLVNVNDLDPEFDKDEYRFDVLETSAIPAVVGSLRAFETDSVGNQLIPVGVEYSITSTQDVFELEASTDLAGFPIAVVRAVVKLDFEGTKEYTLGVKAVNTGYVGPPRETSCTVVITLVDANDNKPVWKTKPGTATVVEGVPRNVIVGVFEATDADSDERGTVTYAITSIEPAGNDNTFYIPDEGIGQVVTNTVYDLGCESGVKQDTYVIVVQAQDGGSPPKLSETVELTVKIEDANDCPPVFKDSVLACTIEEHRDPGVMCTPVSATDGDGAGVFSTVSFSLTGGEGFFKINDANEIITTNELDIDLRDEFILTVTAADGGDPALTATATVTVTVADANDHAPVFRQSQYSAVVAEGQIGANLVKVEAVDVDLIGNVISYAITDGDDGNQFVIDDKTGQLSTSESNVLDYEVKKSVILTVTASDSASASKSSDVEVIITVTDVNDVKPKIIAAEYKCTLREDTDVGTICASLYYCLAQSSMCF